MSTISGISSASTTTASSATSSSEIDWSGLIEEAVAARLAKAESIDLKITKKEAKIAAYGEMQGLLADLVTASQALRAPSGTLAASDDVFRARAGYLTGKGVDADAALGITVADGTPTANYKVEIEQIAQAHKVTSGDVASNTTDLGYSGVISLGTVDGASVEITIDAGMTLKEIAEAINGKSSASGVQASVVKVSDGAYQLVLSTTETGEGIAASFVSGDDVLRSLGVLDGSGAFAGEIQQAQSAIFTVDGIEITRKSNDVDDVIEGVTFNLYQETPEGASITVEVAADLNTIKGAIQTFVDAYNAYRAFAIGQQTLTATDDTTQSEDITQSVLFGDAAFRNINAAVLDSLSGAVGGGSLATIGLSFDASNALKLDEGVLNTALLNDLVQVEELLTFQMTSSSTNLLLLERGKRTPADVTLDLTVDSAGTLTGASVGGDSTLFTVNGTRIIGKAGTAYEGFTFVYAGSTAASIDLGFSGGIAEQLYNASRSAANTSDGSLQSLVSGLQEEVDALDVRSADVVSQAEQYRSRLTERYARLQAEIQQAEALQDYLESMLDSMYA